MNEPFTVIIDSIATLYNNLNLMWLTSSFYGRKEHMERLIESISNLIADRISAALAVPNIFRLLKYFNVILMHIYSIVVYTHNYYTHQIIN